MTKPKIIISRGDCDGLYALIEQEKSELINGLLINEFERAEIVESKNLPDNVVRMNSTVTFTMTSTNKTFARKLVYPSDTQQSGTLSILTPVGSALIGLSAGQEIEWPLDQNRSTIVHIDSIENNN
jgi:regulator of nucleoside diphosphate kinase